MKAKSFVLSFVVVLLLLAGSLAPAAAGGPALVRIAMDGPQAVEPTLDSAEAAGVPVYARLGGDAGPALLAGATAAQIEGLQAQGLVVTVLDADMEGASYYLAYPMPGLPRLDWTDYGRLLLDGGREILLRTTAEDANRLAEQGAELQAISLEAKPLRPRTEAGQFPTAITPDPLIQNMIDQVTSTEVYSDTGDLSGEWPVTIGGLPYTLTTRATYSGTPIQKATQFTGQHLADLGLNVEYHQWAGSTYPNVIGELPGQTNPDDIFIIGGHLDDRPYDGPAPGADDNASGSVATLLAADILTQYEWDCTLRFALWTGEEQGMLGSQVYAQRAYNAGENIVGYLNLDMIAYNTLGSSRDIDLHANSSIPATLDLANLFADVVSAYNLDLIPQVVPNGTGFSDHSSFWNYGYTSILAIEDMDDFNPYYHLATDLLENVDLDYYTDFVKASIGTFAHMTGCLIPKGLGSLDGHVTDAGSATPIEGAELSMADPQGKTYPATTDPSGYYTRTLVAGTYTVTASALGYLPATVTGVAITTDTVTTLDFALGPVPTYTVSGTVTSQGTGLPLAAEVEFQGADVTVGTDPASGTYSAALPAGDYVMYISAYGHYPEERPIVVDQDQTQDFGLERLPCVLLVDDDVGQGYETYYEDALLAVGQDYELWTIGPAAGPTATELAPYGIVIWLTGDDWETTLTADDQAALTTYLDGGGQLFVSGQDIGYDIGTTSLYQNYLHASYLHDDTNSYDLTGLDYLAGVDVVIQGGDGAGNQVYPSNVAPQNGGTALWDWDNASYQNAGVAYQDSTYGVSYFAFGFEAIDNQADRTEVMSRTLRWLGGCTCDPPANLDFSWAPPAPETGETVVFTGTADGKQPMTYEWDFGDGGAAWGEIVSHTYALGGDFSTVMTATNESGQATAGYTVTVTCNPADNADFAWTPPAPETGQTVIFTGTAGGSLPITYEWDFGDGDTAWGEIVTHTYALGGDYTGVMTATNPCGQDTASYTVTVICNPVEILTVTAEITTCTTSFAADLAGSAPITYTWDLGYLGLSHAPAPTFHVGMSGTHPYTLTVVNCGETVSDTYTSTVTVACEANWFYVPLILKNW